MVEGGVNDKKHDGSLPDLGMVLVLTWDLPI